MRILIVDDDEAYLHLLRMLLQKKGHEVYEAADGKYAWHLMQKNPFQFVITDWMLPELDGLEFVRLIRSASFPLYTYIIMLTAKRSRDDVVDGLESGADDYLTKPFDLSELRARIGIGERILDLETRLRESLAKLEVQATQDSLTGLLNRRALYDFADRERSRSEREKSPLSIVYFDIDHFKLVNDQYGHLAGDDALCMVAKVLMEKKRKYDYAGRWGGEEFLVILPGADLDEAHLVAERLRLAISSAKLPLTDGRSISINASFGVACAGRGGLVSIDKLIAQADEALYRAKQSGGDQVMVHPKE